MTRAEELAAIDAAIAAGRLTVLRPLTPEEALDRRIAAVDLTAKEIHDRRRTMEIARARAAKRRRLR